MTVPGCVSVSNIGTRSFNNGASVPSVRRPVRLSAGRSLPQTQPSSAPACLPPSLPASACLSGSGPVRPGFIYMYVMARRTKIEEKGKKRGKMERKRYSHSSTRRLRCALASLSQSLRVSLYHSRSLLLPPLRVKLDAVRVSVSCPFFQNKCMFVLFNGHIALCLKFF